MSDIATHTYQNYPAENLVQGGGFKKWKGGTTGEKQVSLTLQFEKAAKIHQIDIGNEGSAFVEVLVGKSTSKDDDFQVILVASAFMSPLDSRAAKNMTSVRMFTSDKMSKAVVEQKWDRVKVVCTQPFNKTIQYGLAFIKFHSPPEDGEPPTPKQGTLGGFKLKPEQGDTIKTGTLFSHRDKERTPATPLSGAAAVRAASKLAEETQNTSVKGERAPAAPKHTPQATTPKHTPQPTKRKHDDEVQSSSSKRQSIDKHDESSSSKTPLRKQSTSLSSVASSTKSSKPATTPPLTKTKSEPPKSSKDVSFHKLMKKVVFVMSGFQNPSRGQLRDKAMEMGADYKPDWGKTSTHLICAFENTPKYNQVRGKGRIVKKEWILDCYKAKKLLPWRKYRLGRAKSPPDGSSSESDSEDEIPRKLKQSPKISPKKDADPYGGDTDSGEDTEDEIRRVQQTDAKKPSPKKPSPTKNERAASKPDDDIYDAPTDDEMTDEGGATNGINDDSGDELPELPDFFKTKKFFFFGSLHEKLRRQLKRFIIAYNGGVDNYMGDQTSYVITESDWDDKFDQALSDNPSLAFIRPDWVLACDNQQKLLPFQKYVVVPR